MRERRRTRHGERVLVLAPTQMDGDMSRSVLTEAGLECHVCAGPRDLCRELGSGCGVVLLTEDALLHEDYGCMVETLRDQPPWSDLPVVVLTRGGADSPLAARAIDTLGNVVVLEQPVRVSTLVSAVRMALRARRRQYQVGMHLEERLRNEERLREADRRKDEFLAMLAHELRNPLSAIANAIELAQTPDIDHEHGKASQQIISRQVKHLTRLIDDLLDVSRITRGKIDLKKDLIDAVLVIGSAVESVRPLLHARRHQLDLAVESALWVEADPTRLEQILVNLLSNAAKYTEPGGKVWLSASRMGDAIDLTVRDNGIGIPPARLPAMFELFTQGDRSLARTEGGLGIGLTLVKSLAEMHGGSVDATSQGVGQGSQFTVRLPAASAPPAAEPRPAPAASRPESTRRRILLVDDNADSVSALARLLRLLGHEVGTAHSGPEALAMAPVYSPDVVLLDIGLPGMSGYQVAAQLRKHETLCDVLIIAISGYGRNEDQHKSRRAGFDHYLVKPVDHERLTSLLGRARHPSG